MKNAPLPLEDYQDGRYRADQYDQLYSGFSGVVMKASHRLMERRIRPQQNARVLEFGGGAMPHWYWMDPSKMESFTLSDIVHEHQSKIDELRTRISPNICLAIHDFEPDPTLSSLPGNYTRIIASHVLEHVNEPERLLLNCLNLLSDDGILSIAIPCDPGWFWRLGQLLAFRSYRPRLRLREYDLVMSRQHINSTQRLLKIARYYFDRVQTFWFPTMLPVVDLNLICVLHLERQYARHIE